MSDRHDRHEFLQLVDEAMNFGDADQLTANDRELRASALIAYFRDLPRNESDPRWAATWTGRRRMMINSLGRDSVRVPLPGHRSVRAGTDDHTSVRVWLSDFFDP